MFGRGGESEGGGAQQVLTCFKGVGWAQKASEFLIL